VTGFICTTNEAYNAQTARQPRLAIRRNQLIKKPFSIKKFVVGSVSTLGLLSIIGGCLLLAGYIQHLRTERTALKGEISYLQTIGADNAKVATWFNSAFALTHVTAYVPYLRGINGGGKQYANGEPVLPLAASRQALRNGTVAMGDYVLLVGQIKDMKGPSVGGHSFDIHVPDAATAAMIGNRPFKYLNLSRAPVPMR